MDSLCWEWHEIDLKLNYPRRLWIKGKKQGSDFVIRHVFSWLKTFQITMMCDLKVAFVFEVQ